MSPLISIITVTYNAASTLQPTLTSVSKQEGVRPGTDYEMIIMDGDSKDNTLEVARRFAPDATSIFSEPDRGIYDAMNKALDRANGKYYMFLNAGDSLHSKSTLSDIVNAIHSNDFPGVVYGQTNLVDSNRNFVGPRHLSAPENLNYHSFENGMLICHQAFIALARIAPYYNTDYRFSADFEWCLRILQHSRKNVYIPEVLIDYLSEGTTTANRYASLRERFRIMCYYYGTMKTIGNHFKFLPRFFKALIKTNKK